MTRLTLLILSFFTVYHVQGGNPPHAYTYRVNAYPSLHTTWARLSGGKVLASNMATFIDSAFHVVDDHGMAYTITRFRITYKRKAQYKDDETGKVFNTTMLLSREFFNTPKLEPIWITNIKSNLQAGEEFTIDTVVVTDEAGHKYMAPDLFFQLM